VIIDVGDFSGYIGQINFPFRVSVGISIRFAAERAFRDINTIDQFGDVGQTYLPFYIAIGIARVAAVSGATAVLGITGVAYAIPVVISLHGVVEFGAVVGGAGVGVDVRISKTVAVRIDADYPGELGGVDRVIVGHQSMITKKTEN